MKALLRMERNVHLSHFQFIKSKPKNSIVTRSMMYLSFLPIYPIQHALLVHLLYISIILSNLYDIYQTSFYPIYLFKFFLSLFLSLVHILTCISSFDLLSCSYLFFNFSSINGLSDTNTKI